MTAGGRTSSGIDGILAVTPYYNRPSQAGLEAHFRAVAAASPLPVLLYDIPVRTGRKISTELLVRLAEDVPTIVGVKDAAQNPAETARLVSLAPDDFEVYSGDDSLTLPLLAVGAVGVIGVATHWCAAEAGEMIAAFAKGDVERAREINARLLPSCAYETSDAAPNPVPAKAMLELLGLPVGECRLPDGPAPARPRRRGTSGRPRARPALAPASRRSRTGGMAGPRRLVDMTSAPVTVTFLGGLGEIGRNCAAIEVEGRIMLLDCGLMFPDADMLGIDLVLPDFTACASTATASRAASSPTATRTTSAACRSCCASCRSRSSARPSRSAWPATASRRPACSTAPSSSWSATASGAGSARSTASSSRSPTRCPTASPPRSTRRRARSCTPATSSSTSRRSTAGSPTWRASAPSPQNEGVRLLLSDSTNADQHGHSRVGDVGRQGALRPVPRARRAGASSPPASPATSTASSRSPTPPSASTGWSPPSACRCGRTCGSPARWACSTHPRLAPARHRGRRATSRPGKVCVISTGSQGEPMSALALMAANESRWLKLDARRHGDPQLAPDPRQRDERVEGDRRPRAPRRRGRALGHRGRARHRPRQAGGAEDAPVDRPARVVHPGARRVPPPREPRPPGRADGRAPPTTCSSARTATSSCSTDDGLRKGRPGAGRLPLRRRLGSATSATACCATGGCWPRRAWSS